MFEGVIVILGLCITLLPPLLYLNYLLSRINKVTRFDEHLGIVRDKKGNYGVILAYGERILFGIVVSSMGILMSEFFDNEMVLQIFVISLVLYVIVRYLDNLNEK